MSDKITYFPIDVEKNYLYKKKQLSKFFPDDCNFTALDVATHLNDLPKYLSELRAVNTNEFIFDLISYSSLVLDVPYGFLNDGLNKQTPYTEKELFDVSLKYNPQLTKRSSKENVNDVRYDYIEELAKSIGTLITSSELEKYRLNMSALPLTDLRKYNLEKLFHDVSKSIFESSIKLIDVDDVNVIEQFERLFRKAFYTSDEKNYSEKVTKIIINQINFLLNKLSISDEKIDKELIDIILKNDFELLDVYFSKRKNTTFEKKKYLRMLKMMNLNSKLSLTNLLLLISQSSSNSEYYSIQDVVNENINLKENSQPKYIISERKYKENYRFIPVFNRNNFEENEEFEKKEIKPIDLKSIYFKCRELTKSKFIFVDDLKTNSLYDEKLDILYLKSNQVESKLIQSVITETVKINELKNREPETKKDKSELKFENESVSYLTLDYLGMEVPDFDFDYLQNVNSRTQNKVLMKPLLIKVRHRSQQIIEMLIHEKKHLDKTVNNEKTIEQEILLAKKKAKQLILDAGGQVSDEKNMSDVMNKNLEVERPVAEFSYTGSEDNENED